MSNKRLELINKNKELVEQNRTLKATLESNGLIMDKAKPILECVLPYIQRHSEDIEYNRYDFGDLQPALDAMLEFEENEDD